MKYIIDIPDNSDTEYTYDQDTKELKFPSPRIDPTSFMGLEIVLTNVIPYTEPDGVKNNKVNLCDSCNYIYPECPSERYDVMFGDGVGKDNICCCAGYRAINEREIKQKVENEVWEFAKEVRLKEFIDEEGRLHGYISSFNSYSEAKAKHEELKKFEDEIRVGDEVEYVEDHRKKIVVTSTYSDGWFDAIDSNGYLYINRNPVMWKKTGRHFPELIELLKKMGDESYV